MVFSSHAFLVFLLSILLAYWLVNRWVPQANKAFLVLASLVFYGFWIPKYLILLGISLAFNYLLSAGLRGAAQRLWLLYFGVATNLVLIGYYKYLDFFIGGLNGVFQLDWPLQQIALPIGISFFTFQQIGYLVDVYQEKVERPKPLDYVFFIVFFPQLIAGPIVMQSDFLPQVHAKKDWSLQSRHLVLGLALFSFGLFKKTVLADNIGRYCDSLFYAIGTGQAPGLLDAWMAAITYSFQIYFDFSGYSDMAAGLAFLWGFQMPLNFFSPYKAASIIEFWRRWHISLSCFLRDYLYIPLGGNRHGFQRTMLAVMATMLLGGMWHGAGWQFIIWGGLHGMFLVVNHCWRRLVPSDRVRSPLASLATPLGVVLTYAIVCVAWVYFRSADLTQANLIVKAMFGFGASQSFTPTSRGVVTFVWLYFLIVWFLPNTAQLFHRHQIFLPNKIYHAARSGIGRQWAYAFNPRWAAVTAIGFSVGWFALSNLSPFLYFQF